MVKGLGVSLAATIISILGWYLYPSVHNRRSQPHVEPHVINQENDHYARDGLDGANVHGCSSEGSNDGPILTPEHKIFLSHSGAQKEFVVHLCKAFEDQGHYPFFDRRHDSLPKGERFPELIVQATEQCEMLIVVVSNEYFMSKWPMIELSAFIQAHKLHNGSNKMTKILPLFYGLSVSELDNEGMQKKWFQAWKTFAEADPKKRINVNDWKYAFNVLRSFNGLSYDKNLKEVVAYKEDIVSHVCKSIAPDIKWDDSHVQGKPRICEVIREKIEGIGASRKYNVKVVGVYGLGGMGKTTICETLCNEFSSKYEGRVCHIEFPSVFLSDSKELFQKVLKDLTRKSMEVIQQLNEGECKDILRKSLFKQRTFLAIDNISDNYRSIQHAKTLLDVPYHMDSLVVVTARSRAVLELLGLDGDACLEMPDLEESDAVSLFLHHAASGKQFFEDEEMHNVMTCVRRCYVSKGNGKGHHYHPLALKSLGLQLGCHGEHPSSWVSNLQWARTFNFFSGRSSVFDILRSSFDLLHPRDQTLFMDVGHFCKWIYFSRLPKRIEWLCAVYNEDKDELLLRLEHLKRKGLLQDVDLRSGRISIHDLYLEFAELEAMGSFNESTKLNKRMWVYIKNNDLTELLRKPKGGCWYKLIRLSIIQSSLGREDHVRIGGMEGIKWDYFSNVEVLQLSGLHWGHGALNLVGLLQLRVLELLDVSGIDRVEGLEKLNHLTYIGWWFSSPISRNGMGAYIVGQLPSSLKQLIIWRVQVVLESNLLAQCHNLSRLELYLVEACSLDLSNCWSLNIVRLTEIRELQTLLGLGASHPSNLHSLVIHDCKDLVDIPGIDHLIDLKKLRMQNCPNYKMPSLCDLTELQVLSISSEQRLVVHAMDCFPSQLRKLHLRLSQLSEGLNLTGFKQLEVLDLSESSGLTSLVEVGDLPALQCLNLRCCEHLLRLPDLSMSRKLQELDLEGCSALELHEKDIQILSKLPLLQPVLFSGMKERGMFRLDLVHRKVLIHSSSFWAPRWEFWKAGEWEEQDLGTPPIKIGMRGTCELDIVDNKDWDSD